MDDWETAGWVVRAQSSDWTRPSLLHTAPEWHWTIVRRLYVCALSIFRPWWQFFSSFFLHMFDVRSLSHPVTLIFLSFVVFAHLRAAMHKCTRMHYRQYTLCTIEQRDITRCIDRRDGDRAVIDYGASWDLFSAQNGRWSMSTCEAAHKSVHCCSARIHAYTRARSGIFEGQMAKTDPSNKPPQPSNK